MEDFESGLEIAEQAEEHQPQKEGRGFSDAVRAGKLHDTYGIVKVQRGVLEPKMRVLPQYIKEDRITFDVDALADAVVKLYSSCQDRSPRDRQAFIRALARFLGTLLGVRDATIIDEQDIVQVLATAKENAAELTQLVQTGDTAPNLFRERFDAMAGQQSGKEEVVGA